MTFGIVDIRKCAKVTLNCSFVRQSVRRVLLSSQWREFHETQHKFESPVLDEASTKCVPIKSVTQEVYLHLQLRNSLEIICFYFTETVRQDGHLGNDVEVFI